MLKKFGLGLVFVGALMFGVCTVNTVLVDSVMATSHEQGEKDKPEQSSRTRGPVLWEKVVIAQVPAVVKAAIEKETAGGTIGEIVKQEADGKACYAVDCVKDGVKKTLKLTEAGVVVASEDVSQLHTWDFPGKLTEKGDVVASDEKKADIAHPQSPEGSAGGFGGAESDGKSEGSAGGFGGAESNGTKIDIAQVPAVVKAAIEKETAGGTIGEIVKQEADGKACYAVDCVKDGVKKTLKLTEAGVVVASDEKKADIAHPQSPEGSAGGFGGAESNGTKVDIAQVPAVVKAAIEKETAGGTIGEIVKQEADGKACYAVECVKNGVKKTLKLTEAGNVVAGDEKKADIAHPQSPEGSAGGFGGVESDGKEVDIAQVPAVVRAAIEKETAGGAIGKIVKCEADGKVCYAVEYVKDGVKKTLKLTEAGKIK